MPAWESKASWTSPFQGFDLRIVEKWSRILKGLLLDCNKVRIDHNIENVNDSIEFSI
jgi:hypothetical protein